MAALFDADKAAQKMCDEQPMGADFTLNPNDCSLCKMLAEAMRRGYQARVSEMRIDNDRDYLPWMVNARGPEDGPPYEVWHTGGPGGPIGSFDDFRNAELAAKAPELADEVTRLKGVIAQATGALGRALACGQREKALDAMSALQKVLVAEVPKRERWQVEAVAEYPEIWVLVCPCGVEHCWDRKEDATPITCRCERTFPFAQVTP